MVKFSLIGYCMRFLAAAVLYLISLTLILVGIAERTVFAPAPTQKYSVQIANQNNYVFIDHATLTKFDGTPQLTVSGGASQFVAVGRESDVLGWLADSRYASIAFNAKASKLESTDLAGFGPSALPSGSDLWREETNSSKPLTYRVNTSDDAAVLIASDGLRPAPSEVSLIWVIGQDLLLSNILISSGLALLLLAVIANFWSYYTMRKNRGPRRKTPKAPHGPKYRPKRRPSSVSARGRRSARNLSVALSVSALLISGVQGCAQTPQVKPTPTATSDQENDPPVLNARQIQRIVSTVTAVANQADEAKDAAVLEERFAGPALAARKAHYLLQSKSTAITALPKISDQVISFSLPAASKTWPRTLMVVTNAKEADQLSQMLVLQQSTPRENFKVWYAIDVLPGVEFPTVSAPEVGAIPVAADSLFLKIAPNLIPDAFGSIIDRGGASSNASLFDLENDPFYEQVSKSQADTIAKLKKANVSIAHKLGDPNVISLATSDTGALVAVYMTDTYTIKPKKANSAVAVEGNEQLMLGSTGSARGIKSTYGDLLLFYVPGIASDSKIKTLGATQVLISVKAL